MIWLMMLLASCAFVTGALLSYHPTAKNSDWFPFALGLTGFYNGLFWAVATKYTRSPEQLFGLSLAWDAIAIVSYSVLPLMVYTVELTPRQWVGLALVLAGAALSHRS